MGDFTNFLIISEILILLPKVNADWLQNYMRREYCKNGLTQFKIPYKGVIYIWPWILGQSFKIINLLCKNKLGNGNFFRTWQMDLGTFTVSEKYQFKPSKKFICLFCFNKLKVKFFREYKEHFNLGCVIIIIIILMFIFS